MFKRLMTLDMTFAQGHITVKGVCLGVAKCLTAASPLGEGIGDTHFFPGLKKLWKNYQNGVGYQHQRT